MSSGILMKWPYPIQYEAESQAETDVLILGGGIAGCWAAISVARKGVRVAIVEKAEVRLSGGGGAGCDHWMNTPNPCSGLTAEDMVDLESKSSGGYCNALSFYITGRESYDTLLELEKLGAKIRDTEDEFKDAAFRDEESKLLFAYDYINRFNLRVWGAGTKDALSFKHALYNECRRLGVEIFDRVQATSLLTAGGEQGARVVGATGLNVRTGAFHVFKAKATVICLSRPQRIWRFISELSGFPTTRPHTCIGNGHAIAWRAGAEFAQMERSTIFNCWTDATGFPNLHCQSGQSSSFACRIVDVNGKEAPWVDRDGRILNTPSERCRPAPGQSFLGERSGAYEYMKPRLIPDLPERVRKGEFTLPLYVDLPGMPEEERRVIWGMMIGQEGKTKSNTLAVFRRAGFDPSRHQPQNYDLMSNRYEKNKLEWWREQYRVFGELGDCGGLMVDWDLKTNLEGLYAAGDQIFASNYHSHAATTGRYAGRKAAEYALTAGEPVIYRGQVDNEKIRVYVPVKRDDGVGWKELNAGSAMIMSKYCGTYKNEELMKIGLWSLQKMEDEDIAEAFASDPHKLGRTLDVIDLITVCKMITHSCLARKGSSRFLNFYRLDYPELDSPEWHKWITIRQDNEEVEIGERPIDFWGPLKENYEDHNRDYTGHGHE